MHKFHSLNVVTCFPPMSEVFFSTDLCRHHTFCGGVSRVVRAMAEKTRSRSPVRVPDEAAMSEVPKVLPEALEPKGADEEDKASLAEVNQETPEESTGRVVVNTMLAAAKSLEACVGKLEANTALLENVQSDSQSLPSLVAGVNYYASTTKASQAAQTAQHKQVAWDWLSSQTDKSPLKDTLKSIAYQSQCTSKAAYKMVETASNIFEELKSHKTVMAEQCTLMKTIASNQVEVSKLLKAAIGEEKSDVPPSGGTAAAGVLAGSTMPPYPPGFPQPLTTFGNIAPAPFMPFVLRVLSKPNSGDSSPSWRRLMNLTSQETPVRLHTRSRKCHQRIPDTSKWSTSLATKGLLAQLGVTKARPIL